MTLAQLPAHAIARVKCSSLQISLGSSIILRAPQGTSVMTEQQRMLQADMQAQAC